MHLSDETQAMFGNTLLGWYRPERRPMPWKSERDPYRIWVSEIILQQTRVAQGHDYYLRFIAAFPNIVTLAESSLDEVLRAWQGLGYYRRAIHLHEGARQVMSQFDGKLPEEEAALLQIKGIGPYAAAAIGSFAFGLPLAVVDGNVFRILARYFGIESSIDDSAGIKQFRKLAQQLILDHHPAQYNQAIMDFGALICTPANPSCVQCPLKTNCHAFRNNSVNHLPIRTKKAPRKIRHIDYLIIQHGDRTLVRKNGATDIYRHMYEFTSLTSDQPNSDNDIRQQIMALLPRHVNIGQRSKVFRHTLTHLQLYISFTRIMTDKRPKNLTGYWVTEEELDVLPMPVFLAQLRKQQT